MDSKQSTNRHSVNNIRTLRVCALYPDQLSIYADRGNLMVLRRRCEWRGINFQLASVGLDDELDQDAHDLFYIGGGQDRDQKLCAQDLRKFKRDALHAAAADSKVILAVCGGYQLLGKYYEVDGEQIPGIGLVDLHTVGQGDSRLIGNVAITVDLGDTAQSVTGNTLVGFENHGGRTYLGSGETPLGRVISGKGNNGDDGYEGVLGGPHRTVVGTYLHGPLLPRNPWFADWLIAKALRISTSALENLDDTFEDAAHRKALEVVGV